MNKVEKLAQDLDEAVTNYCLKETAYRKGKVAVIARLLEQEIKHNGKT